jgi:hypothetical protein
MTHYLKQAGFILIVMAIANRVSFVKGIVNSDTTII